MKKVRIILLEELYRKAHSHLIQPGNPNEQFGFMLAGINDCGDEAKLLVRDFIPAPPEALMIQSPACVRPRPQFVQYVWRFCMQTKSVLVGGHSHPFSDRSVGFSGIDDAADRDAFPKAMKYLGPGPHASMVFGRNSLDARWFDPDERSTRPVDEVRILGDELRSTIPTSSLNRHVGDNLIAETYARQVLAFGIEGQRKIQCLTVGVVGAGGLGSIVCELLNRIGVNKIIVVDNDVVEETNLNRLFGSQWDDALKRLPKVQVMARHIGRISPKTKVVAIQDSVLSSEAQEQLKTCDVLFGCTDTASSRIELNRISNQYLIPYFDTGSGIQAGANNQVVHAGGQVRIVIPGKGCLNCIKGLNVELARQESMSPEMRQIAIKRGYIRGADVHAPSVASLNCTVASLAITEFMALATGVKPLHRYLFYDMLAGQVRAIPFVKKDNCMICGQGGLLGAGDHGTPMQTIETEVIQPRQGDINMAEKTKKLEMSIEATIVALQERGFDVSGDSHGRWMAIKNVPLGKVWNRQTTDVMVKLDDANNPIILIPQSLSIRAQGSVCPNLLQGHTYLKGCRRLCPNLIQGMDGQLVEFLVLLLGLLAAPGLCGLDGCEKADGKVA